MDDIVIMGIICFIGGCWLGFKANDIIMRFTFKKMIEEAGLTDKDLNKFIDHYRGEMELDFEEELPVINIKVEKHNNELYAFRKDNDQFLGQGSNVESLIERMGEKLRNVRLVITPEDGGELVNGRFNFDVKSKKISSES
jgi:hypothetical protein